MDTTKQIDTPYNNAAQIFNKTNSLLLENNILDNTGPETAQLEQNPANRVGMRKSPHFLAGADSQGLFRPRPAELRGRTSPCLGFHSGIGAGERKAFAHNPSVGEYV